MNAFTQTVGFNGPAPLAIIVWHRDGKAVSKTICLDKEDMDYAMKRHSTPGDLYNSCTPEIFTKNLGGSL